jgi:hypothetical protein
MAKVRTPSSHLGGTKEEGLSSTMVVVVVVAAVVILLLLKFAMLGGWVLP